MTIIASTSQKKSGWNRRQAAKKPEQPAQEQKADRLVTKPLYP